MTSDSGPGLGELRLLFAEALKIDEAYVTPATDFLLAGGQSLSALTIAVAAEQLFGVPVRVRDVFECSTPEQLHTRLTARGAEPLTASHDTPPASAAAVHDVDSDLGAAARWLWMERQRAAVAPAAYNIACLLSIEGEPDLSRLSAAVVALHQRYPVLRSTFVERQGEPRAVVHPDGATLRFVDLHDSPDPAPQRLIDDLSNEPFDPAVAPLTRMILLRLPDDSYQLLIVTDHLVCDGQGLSTLAADLVELYQSGAAPAPAVAPVHPAVQHRDKDPRATVEAWRKLFDPYPEPLSLPISHPRQSAVGPTELVTVGIDGALVDRLTTRARDARVGAFVAMAAGVARALSKLTGSDDVCLGTAVDLRAQRGLARTAGFHVATVPLRIRVPDAISAAELLAGVAASTMDAVDHSDVPYGELIAELDPPRMPWRNPLFDVWVALLPHIDTGPARPGGIALRGGPIPLRYGLFELSIQFAQKVDGLVMLLQYDPSRYEGATAERIAERVIDSLGWLAGDEAPQVSKPEPVFGGFSFDA